MYVCVCMLDIVSMCVYVCIHVSRGACIILLELGLLAIDIAPSVDYQMCQGSSSLIAVQLVG